MKYKSKYDIIMNGKIFKSRSGVVEMPFELPKTFIKIDEEKKTDYKELAINAGLEGDELKKFMKKNAQQKQKQLEKLKES